MRRFLVITDVAWVRNEVHAALSEPDCELTDLTDPEEAAAIALDGDFDAVVADLQIGSMGGMAVTRAIRDAVAREGDDDLPVVMLLDRTADAFLAKRAGATRWVVKPFNANELRIALDDALTPDDTGHPDGDSADATVTELRPSTMGEEPAEPPTAGGAGTE